MLSSCNKKGFSAGNWISVATVEYITHEYGTEVVDRKGNHIGDFPTEAEAVECIREISQQFFEN